MDGVRAVTIGVKTTCKLVKMTVKRRNHGRNKKGRGHVKRVHCVSTSKMIPKDKAIKRFVVRYVKKTMFT